MQAKPKAYSYIRISSKRQLDGDGLARQLRDAREYADENGLELDEQLQDVGSGYHGKHVKFGELGGFLTLVDQGKITVGSTLIVESLDRLSREDVLVAQGQFIDILIAGITIVTLIDKQVYHKDRDYTQLVMSLSYMSRANNESSEKSKRASKTLHNRRVEALEGHKRYNHHLGHWIDQTRIGTSKDYTFSLNSHAETIQRIFEMADSGVGTHSIARTLNQTNTPVFRSKINKLNQWRDATVAMLLRDETVIGTYHVYGSAEKGTRKRNLLGPPIPNYYPAAISEELFWRVQRKRPEHSSKGRVGKTFSNLFARNTSCAKCGNRLKMYVGTTAKPRRYLTCSQRVLTGGKACDTTLKMFRYDDLENAVLEYVTEFHAAASEAMQVKTFDKVRLQKDLTKAREALAVSERKRANAVAAVQEEDDPIDRAEYRKQAKAAREKVEQQTAYVKEIEANIREAADKSRTLSTVTEQIALDRLIWTTGTDEEVLKSRARVAAALRQFISTVEIDFDTQEATIWVGGFTSAYKFDSEGNLKGHFNILPMLRRTTKRTLADHNAHGRVKSVRVLESPDDTPAMTDQMMIEFMQNMGWQQDRIDLALKASRRIVDATA